MLKQNPKDRPSVQQVLKSKWLTQNTQNRFLKSVTINQTQILNNLKRFGKQNKAMKTTIAYIIGLLTTAEERGELEKNFKSLDQDKDGLLSFEEIQNGYQKIFGESLTSEQLKQIFDSVDTDGSGYIDYNEFIAATMDATLILNQEKLKMIFRQLDRDNTGTISLQELYSSLGNVKKGSEDFLNNLLNGISDQKQLISYEDFLELLNVPIDNQQSNQEAQLNQVQNILNQRLFQSKKLLKFSGKKPVNFSDKQTEEKNDKQKI